MREVLDELLRWWRADQPAGLATVVGTWRSAPRPPGATMLVGPDGGAVGSVSGGCVEGAVYQLAQQVIESGEPVLARYGVGEGDAFAIGLTCGGEIEVFVERVDRGCWPELEALAESLVAHQPVAVATMTHAGGVSRGGGPSGAGGSRSGLSGAGGSRSGGSGGGGSRGGGFGGVGFGSGGSRGGVVRRLLVWPDRQAGTLGSQRLDRSVVEDARAALRAGRTGRICYGPEGERAGDAVTVFISAFAPPPRMVVCGAVDFAAAVVRIGTFLGYRVTICDARPVFATARRFPEAEVVVDWPHRYLAGEVAAGRLDARTVVCVLTHDPKFDVPTLRVALAQRFSYVGAMGSRRTHADRLARLRAAGVTEEQLARLASPIGLDLGARTPEETAVSIAAEIIASRWGGSGQPLTGRPGRIHSALGEQHAVDAAR